MTTKNNNSYAPERFHEKLSVELKNDNGQMLPDDDRRRVQEFLDELPKINWLNPSKDLKKIDVEKQAKFALECLGVEADVEYRKLETKKDWETAKRLARNSSIDSAWDSTWDLDWERALRSATKSTWGVADVSARASAWHLAWDLAWDSALDSAWEPAWESASASARVSAEILMKNNEDFLRKYPNGVLTQLFELWKMGLYPVGVLRGSKKFVIYADPVAEDLFRN